MGMRKADTTTTTTGTTDGSSRETTSWSSSEDESERVKFQKVGGSEEDQIIKKKRKKKKKDPLCVFDDCYVDCESEFRSREDFEEYHRYRKELYENGPFGLTFPLKVPTLGAVYKLDDGDDVDDVDNVNACIQFAIREKKPELELLKITYAARSRAVGTRYFIKFEARDPFFPDQLITYRTTVYRGLGGQEFK
ncbi:hypothetical protein Tsubulata_034396, partial [Turnera subulata]